MRLFWIKHQSHSSGCFLVKNGSRMIKEITVILTSGLASPSLCQFCIIILVFCCPLIFFCILFWSLIQPERQTVSKMHIQRRRQTQKRQRDRERERTSKFSLVSSYKVTNPVKRLQSHDLITSQKPHLQIPSYWGLGLQHTPFRSDTNIQSVTVGKFYLKFQRLKFFV